MSERTAVDGLRGRIAEIVDAFEDADDDFHEAWDAAAGDEEREWRAACALNAARGVCIDALAALLVPAAAPAAREPDGWMDAEQVERLQTDRAILRIIGSVHRVPPTDKQYVSVYFGTPA